jgi:DNA-binding MarR family transcriptional regulator
LIAVTTKIDLLEQTGILRLLLLVEEKNRHIGEIIRDSQNTEGIASQTTITHCRRKLSELDLITEETDTVTPFRTFLIITDKGRLVAEKIREIEAILES